VEVSQLKGAVLHWCFNWCTYTVVVVHVHIVHIYFAFSMYTLEGQRACHAREYSLGALWHGYPYICMGWAGAAPGRLPTETFRCTKGSAHGAPSTDKVIQYLYRQNCPLNCLVLNISFQETSNLMQRACLRRRVRRDALRVVHLVHYIEYLG